MENGIDKIKIAVDVSPKNKKNVNGKDAALMGTSLSQLR
jgi:hypothetical protein